MLRMKHHSNSRKNRVKENPLKADTHCCDQVIHDQFD